MKMKKKKTSFAMKRARDEEADDGEVVAAAMGGEVGREQWGRRWAVLLHDEASSARLLTAGAASVQSSTQRRVAYTQREDSALLAYSSSNSAVQTLLNNIKSSGSNSSIITPNTNNAHFSALVSLCSDLLLQCRELLHYSRTPLSLASRLLQLRVFSLPSLASSALRLLSARWPSSAFAWLRSPLVSHFALSSALVVGRGTHAHMSLAVEAPSLPLSRRAAAIVRGRNRGAHLIALSKRTPVALNGTPLPAGMSIALPQFALLEIAGIKIFVLLRNP